MTRKLQQRELRGEKNCKVLQYPGQTSSSASRHEYLLALNMQELASPSLGYIECACHHRLFPSGRQTCFVRLLVKRRPQSPPVESVNGAQLSVHRRIQVAPRCWPTEDESINYGLCGHKLDDWPGIKGNIRWRDHNEPACPQRRCIRFTEGKQNYSRCCLCSREFASLSVVCMSSGGG